MSSALTNDTTSTRFLNKSWMIPSALIARPYDYSLQAKFSLSNKNLRKRWSMPKTSTHVLLTSRKQKTRFFVNIFEKCCGRTGLTTACYWPSYHCIPAQKFVSVSVNLIQNLTPWVLDYDKGLW